MILLNIIFRTYNDIKSGTKACTATTLPRFLFPANQEYDPEDVEQGVFRGHLLLRVSFPPMLTRCLSDTFLIIQVAKHVLQGPTAALEGPGFHRGQQGVAALLNTSSVTPELIAYLAIQVWSIIAPFLAGSLLTLLQTRFALSSESTWSKRDGLFDYDEFFWSLVGILEDDESDAIIKLFNQYV